MSLSLAVACAGCGTESAPDERAAVQIQRDTVSGVPHVTVSGDLPAWTIQERLRLGSASGGPGDGAFAWVSSVGIGPDRQLYVADLGLDHIAVFDSTGRRVETIGRRGQGPGEFESLFSIGWLGPNLMTLDLGNGRLGRWSAQREWLGQEPAVGRLTASPVTHRLYQVGATELVQWAHDGRDGVAQPIWRSHSSGGVVREWSRTAPVLDPPFPDKVVCTMGRGFSWFDHPYALRSLSHPLRGGVTVSARTDRYELVLTNGEKGDTLRVIVRDSEAPALDQAEWAEWTERFDEWLQDKDRSRCRPPELVQPSHKPFIRSLMVDPLNRIWVETHVEAGTLWEVFTITGEPVGAVSGFPFDHERGVPWLAETEIAWIERGDLDAPVVVWARLIGAGER